MPVTDLAQGLNTFTATLPDYELAGRYYAGDVQELSVNVSIRRQLQKIHGDEVRLNLTKIACDVVADRLEIAAIAANDPSAQAVLDQVAKANRFDQTLPDLFRLALEYGDAYLVLDGDAETGVTLYPNSPLTTRVFYDSENPWVKTYAIKRWQIQDPDAKGYLVRINLLYADRIERYVSKAGTKGEKPSDFIPWTNPADDTDVDPVLPNGYGFVPVYHFRTARPYGLPEHFNGYSAQDAINKLAITHLAAIDYLGFPQRVITMGPGQDSTELDDFDADIFHDAETPEATAQGPDLYRHRQFPSPNLTADPGGVWTLPNGSTVNQLQAADSKNFIDSLNQYAALLAQTTNTPLHFLNTTNQVPSGEALRVAEAPLVKKVRNRSISFGAELSDCLTDVLTLFGITDDPEIHWVSPESYDNTDTWSIVQAKLAAGMPMYYAFQQAGLTPDQLDAMGIASSEEWSLKDRTQMFYDIGRGAPGLAALVTAGALLPDEVRQIFTSFFGEIMTSEVVTPDDPPDPNDPTEG